MKLLLQIFLICFASVACSQSILLPPRATNAPGGAAIADKITQMSFMDRESFILNEVLNGNIPGFYRKFCPVTVTNVFGNQTNVATFYAAPECLMVGTDDDYLITPVTPATAQFIAGRLGCVLPTPKMSDAIYAAAEVKMTPTPIPPTAAMTTVAVFVRHNQIVHEQRALFLPHHPLGVLTAGYKKDVVICAKLSHLTHKVAIYGWHKTNGVPIQPLFTGHTSAWVDYSHGIRLVLSALTVNGASNNIPAVLADPQLCGLLSNEGVITNDTYPTNPIAGPVEKMNAPWPQQFTRSPDFGEMNRQIDLGVNGRVLINAPWAETFSPIKPVLLIFYALPNGNSIEQTFGGNYATHDWRASIQQIGAQTRWLRANLTNRTVVVAYLEAPGKSWPAWRHSPGHDDHATVRIVGEIAGIFSAYPLELALTSHSGGGAFVCEWINTVKAIPDTVMRIAFLDSDYDYNRAEQAAKLVNWLGADDEHRLCIIAYHDAIARFNGKPFVSEAGGTWGRSHALLADLGEHFNFLSQTNGALETYTSRDGKIQFLLHENPGRIILHTVQVQRNGFIQAILSGTELENAGYRYFGEPVYTNWIQDEMGSPAGR
jgi:hypothetical protein